jgi:oligosaccharide repeat unit polymerase
MPFFWRGAQEGFMLEALLIITFAGVILASCRRMGMGNPFQIYFMVWFLVISGYYVSIQTYIGVSSEFLIAIFVAKFFSFLLLFIAYSQNQGVAQLIKSLSISERQDQLIIFAQIAVTVALPFAYLRAITLAGGEDIFTVFGYIKLRSAMTQDGYSFGLLGYFFILSYVISSLTTFSYRQGSAHLGRLALSVLVSLSYVYLGTGRTNILLLLCLLITPLVISGAVRLKGILVSVLVLAGLIIFIAVMTAKGISTDAGFLENIDSFSENLKGYTIAPFLALSKLVALEPNIDWGENTFRFFISLQYALGISDIQPVPLIRGYAFVPNLTNVYTAYDVYFRDFSYLGIFIPPAFLIIHYWLYRKAIRFGGVWIFYYSASVYPLVMQFFQDQYFSLASMWFQLGVWYWLLLMPRTERTAIGSIGHA